MIDHKISVQTFNSIEWIAHPLTMTNSSNMTLCNLCKTNLAEIFQESGDYCLCCWQEITCPSV
jgi:hypothetical protein